MLFDDLPEYPMTGFFRLRFSACLNVSALNAAIQMTLERHPLIRSKVVRDAGNRLCWELTDTCSVTLERWSADLQGEYPAAGYVDLTQSAGTRIWLVDRNGAHDLVFQIHHACTDALGMCQLIDDLLIFYARNVAGGQGDAHLRSLNNQRLAIRNRFGLTWRQWLQLFPKQLLGLHVVGKFFVRKAWALRLPAVDAPTAETATFPAVCSFEFSSPDTARILSEAKHRKASVNDLIARDLFVAIQEWRSRYGVGTQYDWIRFFVPINERTAEHEALSAANIMSAVFLERQPRQMTDPETLLRSVQAEMQAIRNAKLGFLFIAAHTLLRRFTRLRDFVIRRPTCLSSCVFSNLGVILNGSPLPRKDGRISIDNVLLDGVEFFAPLRPLTHVTVCVSTYGGRLSLNLHFDPCAMTKSQAEELLEGAVGHLCGSLRSDLPVETVDGQMHRRLTRIK